MSEAEEAAVLCATGVSKLVRWRADAMESIDAAIAAEESYALPRLIKGWMLQGAGDAQYADQIALLLSEAESSLSPSLVRESMLLKALNLATSGQGIESVAVLERWLHDEPTDLLVHHFAHEEIFWTGRADWMRDITEKAAPVWTESTEGYGPFLSLRAFANEEAGEFDRAERYARMAIEIDPADVWAAHAVAHVLLMKGEMQSGIDWLEKLSPNWGHANQMRHHLWWHLCLFLIEIGEHQRILDLLTTEVRNPESALVKAAPAATIDITNFASLLMRLELYGVDVESHWCVLADVCAGRIHNHASAFSNIHDMMVLAATGQFDKADELLKSMRSQYQSQSGSRAHGYTAAGIPVCEAVLAHRKKDYKQVLDVLGGVRHAMSSFGASHAQRDVFYHMLVDASVHEGRDDLRTLYLSDMEQLGFCDVPQRAAYKCSTR